MYKNLTIEKPWGHEYLAYENDEVGLWFLNIKKNHKTSMHCHPKKTTGLILLDGIAEVSFLADKKILSAPDKLMIRRGLFHSTKALSDNALIFEIETPKDKHDLVRLNDEYGRSKKSYEGKEFESLKSENDIWLNDPGFGKSEEFKFSGCTLKLENIEDINIINEKKDNDIIVFLHGGMIRELNNKEHYVTSPGDVGFGKIVKKVSNQLDHVNKNTIIMTISKDE